MDDNANKPETVNFKDLKDLYREISSRENMRKRLGTDAIFASLDRQALQEEGETAFLIEKTDQQSFLTLMAGVIATGPVQYNGFENISNCSVHISGLIYTALLILKPTNTCSSARQLRKSENEFGTHQERLG